MKKMLLLFALVATVSVGKAQNENGFSFYSGLLTTGDSEEFKEEVNFFNLSVDDKVFVHNNLSDENRPVGQIYRVKSYEVVNVAKGVWYADFVVTSKGGIDYKGRLVVEDDLETIIIGNTYFIGEKSIIKSYAGSRK